MTGSASVRLLYPSRAWELIMKISDHPVDLENNDLIAIMFDNTDQLKLVMKTMILYLSCLITQTNLNW